MTDANGFQRLGLNGEAIFHAGPLDQGFWPDGLYTAPTHEAMVYDIDVTKRLGFNTIRKHVKVEPATWYAHCDRVGMLVWQDMPSGEASIKPGAEDLDRSERSEAIFRREYEAMVSWLQPFGCIAVWVLFNEGWGQFKTAEMSAWAKSLDPERVLCAVTGWVDRGTGDLHDWHVYPGPGSPRPEPHRASTLGEFGGLGLPVEGHMWQSDFWGYKSYENAGELTDAFVALFEETHPLVGDRGLSAAIYTQTTDVETEANGLMTYDRRVLKMDEARTREAVTALYGECPPERDVDTILVRETCDEPGEGWERPGFDDQGWGRASHDGVETWTRRIVEIGEGPHRLWLDHEGEAELFLDGESVIRLEDYSSFYPTNPRRVTDLAPGRHLLALRAKGGSTPAEMRITRR